MKYNYIYLNTSYLDNGRLDPEEYNAICLRDVESMEGVQVIQTPLDYSTVLMRRSFNLTKLIDKRFNTSLCKLWYPYLIKPKFNNKKPICFIVSSYNLPLSFFSYLRKKYPDCKLVKIYRDLTKVIGRVNSQYEPDNIRDSFDVLMSFDSDEAKLLNMVYFDEIESKVDVPKSDDYPLYDVFIAAKAKDRLPKIMKAYEIFSKAGLRCYFYLTGVSVEDRIPKDGIEYADINMPYMKMLYYSVNSRCMFDINQGGAVGYTSRFLEAVMYNKKIITDNPFVKQSKYYNSNYIQLIQSIDDIDPSFVLDQSTIIDYKYQNDFSPVNLILQIERLLTNE